MASKKKKKKKTRFIEFRAHVSLDGNRNSDLGIFKVPFKMKVEEGKDETFLVYDDVLSAACEAADGKFPCGAFPKKETVGISIVCKNGEYPVVEESTPKEDIDRLLKKHGCDRALLLPSYT